MVDKKNTAIAGIAVLLCTVLVFFGCEEAGSSSTAAPVAPDPLAAPAAPEVTATPADGQITLSWAAVTGAASYKVFQGTSDNEIRTDITETSVVITGLSNGTAYKFWVAAVNSGGSTPSAEVTATPQAAVTAPAAPEVTATPADGQITLSWAAVTGAASYKVYQGSSDNEIRTDITETSVVITGLSNGTAYKFWVAAVNSGGSTLSAEVTATPRAAVTAPAAPTGLTAAAGVEEVVLAWTAVSGATSYKVYQGNTALEAAITMPTHTVTGLTAGTAHSFTVSAVNGAGESAQSSAASATPTPAVPAGLTPTAGDMQVVLSWTASGNTGVTGYKIRTTGGSMNIADVDISGRTATTGTVTGLTNGQSYSFTIAAVAGSTQSVQSSAVMATPLTAPVVMAIVADMQVTLRWDAVAGAASYAVYQGTNDNKIQDITEGTSAVVTGLTNDQAYSFWVSAVSSSGSSQSVETAATPKALGTAPASAPTVTAEAGANQVRLSWTAVAGATSYRLYQNTVALMPDISGRVSHTVTGLTAGTSYSFTVSAMNSAGEGAKSTAVTATPTPPAVSGLAATAGVQQVDLAWTASTTTGVTGYKIRQTVDGAETEINVTGMSTASHTVSSLTAGKSYSFTIAAVAGSAESTQSTAVTATPTPPAVSGLAATAGAEEVALSWTASTVTGVTGYKIRQTVDGTETEIDVTGASTASHTVSSLTAGKSHSFTIAAVAGSAESTQSTAVTATPTPPVPTGLSAAAGVAQVVLTWTASTNAGVTSYKIRQTVDGAETEIDVTGASTASHTVSSLVAGKSYSFTIAAVTAANESVQSDAVTAVPTPPAVSGLAATAGVQQVDLAWTASTTTGVTGYKVRQTVDGTETEIDVSGMAAASHTVTGLTAGKSYSFTIAAVAGTAESTQSTAVTATPTPPAVSVLAATAGAEEVALSWTASTVTGVTGYKIRQTVDGTETEIDVTGTSTASHTVSSLTAGKSYSFTIAAVAGSAESTQSTAVTATPTPPVPTGLSAAAGVAQVVLTWTASTNAGVTSYKIRQTVDGAETEIDVTGMSTASHTVSSLTAGKSYSFTIAAVAGSAESTQSTAVTAAPTPPAVSGLAATAGVQQVDLAWTASTTTGVTGYKIRQTVDDTETEIDVTGMSTASHTVSSLEAGKSHSFTIAAVAGSAESTQSTAVTATPTPPAVTGLMATAGSEQVVLSWTALADAGVIGYRIRQTVDGTETEIDVTGASTASHTVSSLTVGKSYSFTIAAVAGSAESTQSTAVTATPLIGAPQNVRAAVSETTGSVGSRQQVVLSWDTVTGAASYKIYQDSMALTTLPATLTETTYTVNGLTDGQRYTFEISAVDGSNQEADKSTEVITCGFTDADGDMLIEICTLDHLAQINTDGTSRDGDYELVRNLDFSSQYSYAPGSANWTNKIWRPVNTSTATSASMVVRHDSGQNSGWAPIAYDREGVWLGAFTGKFNGKGYRIENLYARNFERSSLFGYVSPVSVVRNLHVHGNIYGTGFSDVFGILAGANAGSIIACSSSGTADGLAGDDTIGGLTGRDINSDTYFAASYSTANVNGGAGNDIVGGLVGQMVYGTVAASYATGAADGGAGNDYVGGLVGKVLFNPSSIKASYATGAVSNAGSSRGGSLVGSNGGTVRHSYGYGTVNGSGGNANGEKALTAGNIGERSTNAGYSWRTNVWDFGTSSQSPWLKWVTRYTTNTDVFTCDASLLPAGQSCGGIIPGQPERE